MFRIIAYTYEADLHCPACAQARFGFEPEAQTDKEGNRVTPVFSDNECPPGGEYCGTCRDLIQPPWLHATTGDLEDYGLDRETYEALREKHYGKGDSPYDRRRK